MVACFLVGRVSSKLSWVAWGRAGTGEILVLSSQYLDNIGQVSSQYQVSSPYLGKLSPTFPLSSSRNIQLGVSVRKTSSQAKFASTWGGRHARHKLTAPRMDE